MIVIFDFRFRTILYGFYTRHERRVREGAPDRETGQMQSAVRPHSRAELFVTGGGMLDCTVRVQRGE